MSPPLLTIPGGLLIAIEGIDGAGKTSAGGLIAQYCGERGLTSLFSKEPTSLQWGKELRRTAATGRLTLAEELRLFTLDRQMHVQQVIRPAMAAGSVVLVDRYYWSTAAYQGARGADPTTIIAEQETFAPRPDLILLLDLPAATGLQRVRARGDEPNAFEKEAALDHARAIFLTLARAAPQHSIVIDATTTARQVARACLQAFLTTATAKLAAHPVALARFQSS